MTAIPMPGLLNGILDAADTGPRPKANTLQRQARKDSVHAPVEVGAVGNASLASGTCKHAVYQMWNDLINHVVGWGTAPEELAEEEDLIAPRAEVVEFACHFAVSYRDQGVEAPSRIVPDGEGGISFTWGVGESFTEVRISKDLEVEALRFENCRLLQREPLT